MAVTKSTLAEMSFRLGCFGHGKGKIAANLAGYDRCTFVLLLTSNEW